MFKSTIFFVLILSFGVNSYFNKDWKECNLADHNFLTILHQHFSDTASLNIIVLKRNFIMCVDDFTSSIISSIYYRNKKKLTIQSYETRGSKEENNLKINYHCNFDSLSLNKLQHIKRATQDHQEGFLIISWDMEDLEVLMKEYNIYPKHRSTYMILLASPFHPDEEKIEKLLRELWKNYGITNLLVINLCFSPKCFKFDRYNLENFSGKMLSYSINTSLSPDVFKDPLKNLNGHPLPVSLFARTPTVLSSLPASIKDNKIYDILTKSDGYGGQDGTLLANLANYLNFMPDIKIPPAEYEYGYQLPNGTFVGSLGDVVNKEVVISLNGRFLSDYGTDKIEFTTPVSNDVLCIVVPSAQKVPQWLKIFHCFTLEAWLGIFGIYSIATIYWYNVKPINFQKKLKRKRNCFAAFQIYSFFVSASVKLPLLDSQRVFFASCMFFSIIITGTFQGSLVTSFTTTSYYPNINTIQQFDESGLSIGVASMGLCDTFVADNALGKRLKQKIVLINGSVMMKRAAFQRDLAALERRADAKMRIKSEFTTADGFELLHVVKECPRSYHVSYIVSKGSPFLPIFDQAITMFKESGLLNKWSSDTANALIIERRQEKQYETSKIKVFTINDMQTAFYLLSLGLVVAFVIFGIEILINCNNKPIKLIKR